MEEMKVRWQGQEAVIKEETAFEVADAVEQQATLGELAVMRSMPGRIQYAKLSRAYAALLRSVGIPVTSKEVHREFTKALRSAEETDRLGYAVEVIDWLIYVLMDGAPENDGKKKDADDAPGK